jgi:hypothetical protein
VVQGDAEVDVAPVLTVWLEHDARVLARTEPEVGASILFRIRVSWVSWATSPSSRFFASNL